MSKMMAKTQPHCRQMKAQIPWEYGTLYRIMAHSNLVNFNQIVLYCFSQKPQIIKWV